MTREDANTDRKHALEQQTPVVFTDRDGNEWELVSVEDQAGTGPIVTIKRRAISAES